MQSHRRRSTGPVFQGDMSPIKRKLILRRLEREQREAEKRAGPAPARDDRKSA